MRTSSSTRRIISKGKGSPRYSNPKHARNGEMKRAQELRVDEVSVQIYTRKSWDNTKAHFSVAGNARTDEFHKWFGRISRSGIKLQWEIVLRFQCAYNDSKFSFHAEPRQTPASWHMEYIGFTGKRFWYLIFNVWFSPRSSSRNFHHCAPPRERGSVPQATGSGTLFANDKQSRDTIPMPTFAGRPSTMSSLIPVAFLQNSMVGLQRQQKSSDYLFRFCVGCNVMDQRSGDGWFIRGIEVLAISAWKGFSKLRDAGREDCFCSEQDQTREFPVQEEGQSRETESPERGPVSTRKTDRLHDLQQVSSDWRSWYSIGFCWFSLYDDNIQEFDARWDEVLLSMSKIPSYDIFESLSKLRICESAQLKTVLDCTTWRFIRRYRCPVIKNWRPWWGGVLIRNFDYEILTPDTGELKQEQWSRIEREWVVLKQEKIPVTSGKKRPVFERRPMQFPAWE